MTSFNPLAIALDARRVTRGTPEMLAARQHSPFYTRKYRGLPETISAAEPPRRDPKSGKVSQCVGAEDQSINGNRKCFHAYISS